VESGIKKEKHAGAGMMSDWPKIEPLSKSREKQWPDRKMAKALVLAIVLLTMPLMAVHTHAAARIGEPLPSIVFQPLNGTSIRVPDNLKGNVMILHFWRAGCSSCGLEIPALNHLYGRYRGRGLEVLAINVGQPKDRVKAFAASLKVSYPILIDPDGRNAALYDVSDVPRTYIIDRRGIVRYRIFGGATEEMLKKLIFSLF
jgi:peroxiredoxin